MRTTAANIDDADKVMWLHVVTNWLIVGYATWLLRRHTSTFALLRQLYLTTAGDTNLHGARCTCPRPSCSRCSCRAARWRRRWTCAPCASRWRAATCAAAATPALREGEDEDDAFQDADARLDGPANDFSPRSSVKKKKKFQTKPDTKSGFEISKATLQGSDAAAGGEEKKRKALFATRRRRWLEDGFEFDFGGS